jgi:Fe-S-cluster containining protein
MKSLVMDLGKIKRLSGLHEKKNWDFRGFLKWCDHSPKKIDETVHRLYREISAQIDCTECGNCCKEVRPVLDKKDIERLSNRTGLNTSEFNNQYLEENKEEGGFMFKTKACPFLRENRCTCYSDRPSVCRSYPHLHKKNFTNRLMGAIENCSICLIVYNVYESAKQELWD